MVDRQEDADRHLEHDAVFIEKALDLEPENPRWRLWQASHLWLQAWKQLQAGDLPAARADITKSLRLLGTIPLKTLGKLWSARAGWLLAEIEAELGEAQSAQEHRRAALLHADELIQDSRRPIHLDIRLQILLGLGRTAEAQPLADELSRIGYREPGFLKMLSRRKTTQS